MYYRLKPPYAFRGWKKLPFAIQAQYGPQKHVLPLFMEKAPFLDLLSCSGEEDVDLNAFSEKGRQTLEKLADDGIIEQSPSPLPPLESWQHYHVFPSRYLSSVLWSITGRCNFRCRHCLVSAPDARHPQLPLSDCLRIVEEFAECGIRHVDISGGEPLLRSDFEEIVKALTSHEIDIGVIFTNASLMTEGTLEMLKRNRQFPAFQLSFDGLGCHDWLRGVDGAEKEADKAFRLLRRYGFPVLASMCIHRGNRNSLRETVNHLAGLGVQLLRVSAPQNLGSWQQYSREFALSPGELWTVFREYIGHYFEDGMPLDIELGGFFQCKKGKTDYSIRYAHSSDEARDWNRCPYCQTMQYQAYISPEGRLIPCMGFADTALGERFPDILGQHLGTLTLNSFYRDITETRIAYYIAANPECASCGHLAGCRGGCMVEDMSADGDFLVPDRTCCYFHKYIGEDAVRAAADRAIEKFRSPSSPDTVPAE